MISELRWPGDPRPDTGIDIRSLELEPGELAVVDILRRPEVMANLARWNAGTALGESTRRRRWRQALPWPSFRCPADRSPTMRDGGSAVEAVWIIAQQRGLAVQPIVANLLVCPWSRRSCRSVDDLRRRTGRTARESSANWSIWRADAATALVLRIAVSEPASVRSLRDFGRVKYTIPL